MEGIPEGLQSNKKAFQQVAELIRALPDSIKNETIKVSNFPNKIKVANMA